MPPFFAAAALIMASGAAKSWRPEPASRALAAAGLPPRRAGVRTLGLIEIGLGGWSLMAPSRASALSLGLLYLAFAGFLVWLMKAGGQGATCGCLGRRDTPPSLLHVTLDVLAAGTAVMVATTPPRGVLAEAARLPLAGVPFLGGILLIAFLVYLAAAYLPRSFWSYGRVPAGESAPRHFALAPRSDR